jgi:hypothetical protein
VESTDDSRQVLFAEERAVHFGLSDGRGRIRVVPAGARWELDPAFDESTGPGGDEPPGLHRRHGASYAAVLLDDPAEMSDLERQAAIDALLTVDPAPIREPGEPGRVGGLGLLGSGLTGGRRYREARLEIGQTVTVLGQALPWADVREDSWGSAGTVEHAIADDLAEARAAGRLAATPGQAWGNAAIPGFGIGRPTRAPQLDPAANRPEVTGPAADEAAMRGCEIPGHELVLARTPGSELAIYAGAPQVAMQWHDGAVRLGIAGAVMTVVCTLALGAALAGRPWP